MEEPNLWTLLGLPADTPDIPVPDHVWDTALAVAVDPDTRPVDTSLLPDEATDATTYGAGTDDVDDALLSHHEDDWNNPSSFDEPGHGLHHGDGIDHDPHPGFDDPSHRDW